MKNKFLTMQLPATLAGLLMLFGMNSAVVADEIKTPVGQQSLQYQDVDRPQSGMSKAEVEQSYGTPENTSNAVGEPPISSWEYPNYTVYFEHERVIHTVLK